jgi:hypothetical protein
MPLPTEASQGFSVVLGVHEAALVGLPLGHRPQRVTLDSFEVDCTLSESIALESEVTEFEVERGANVNDHRRKKSIEFAIAGVVSDTPLGNRDLVKELVTLAAGPLGLAIDGVAAGKALSAGDAVITREAFRKLQQLFDSGSTGEPGNGTFSIVTRYATFENMVVKSLRFSRDSRTGQALPFTATFKEIRFVATATAKLPILQAPKNHGRKGTKKASDATTDKASGAIKMLKAAGILGDANSPAEIEWRLRNNPNRDVGLDTFD